MLIKNDTHNFISQIFQIFYIFIQLKPSSLLDLYTLEWYNEGNVKVVRNAKYNWFRDYLMGC